MIISRTCFFFVPEVVRRRLLQYSCLRWDVGSVSGRMIDGFFQLIRQGTRRQTDKVKVGLFPLSWKSESLVLAPYRT